MPDLYRAIFERSRHPMAVVDDDGIVRDVNDALAAFMGISRPTLAGVDRREHLEPHAAIQVDAQQAALRAGHGWLGTYRLDGAEDGPVMEVCAEPDVIAGRHLVLYAHALDLPGPLDAAAGQVRAVADTPGDVRLTRREREIVGEIALGATSHQIAERLVVSEHTVRTHVRNAMARTGAQTRAHLVVVAMRAGLVGDALHRVP